MNCSRTGLQWIAGRLAISHNGLPKQIRKMKLQDYIICLRSFPLLVKSLEKESGFTDLSNTLFPLFCL